MAEKTDTGSDGGPDGTTVTLLPEASEAGVALEVCPLEDARRLAREAESVCEFGVCAMLRHLVVTCVRVVTWSGDEDDGFPSGVVMIKGKVIVQVAEGCASDEDDGYLASCFPLPEKGGKRRALLLIT